MSRELYADRAYSLQSHVLGRDFLGGGCAQISFMDQPYRCLCLLRFHGFQVSRQLLSGDIKTGGGRVWYPIEDDTDEENRR